MSLFRNVISDWSVTGGSINGKVIANDAVIAIPMMPIERHRTSFFIFLQHILLVAQPTVISISHLGLKRSKVSLLLQAIS